MKNKIMNKTKKVPWFIKSQILSSVIYSWNVSGEKPHLNKPKWSVDIDSNPYSIYCEYMNQFARTACHGFTYDEAEEWLSETIIKLGLNK